ncbi:MAG: hypothetical protein ACTHNU_12905 [Gaiellales bacterium]
MATKKQQRRRYQRARAHGRGVDTQIERDDEEAKPKGRSSAKSAPPRGRGVPQPPSLSRAIKRSGILCVVFLGLLLYTPLGGKQSPAQKVLFALWMFCMFAGVTLLTERWAYKRYLKQQGKL